MARSLTASQKKRLAREWKGEGVAAKEIAERLALSRGRVSQILSEDDLADADVDDTSERVLKARARVLELQALKLERQLQVEAGSLIPLENVQGAFRVIMKHVGIAADHLRRVGNTEGLDAINAALDAISIECKKHGYDQTLGEIENNIS